MLEIEKFLKRFPKESFSEVSRQYDRDFLNASRKESPPPNLPDKSGDDLFGSQIARKRKKRKH